MSQDRDIEEVALRSIKLRRTIKEKKGELSELKDELREFADENGVEEENIEIKTPLGTVLIYSVKDSLYVSKMSAEDARAFELDLGTLSEELFDKKVKFETVDDFRDKLDELSEEELESVMSYVTERSNSNRVNIPT